MKISLVAINAKYIHSNLAVYSLREAAKKENIQVELLEYTINHYVEGILRDIYKKKPDLLAFSCYIWNIEYVKELVEECRKIMPNLKIWVGGPEVSYDAPKFLKENPAVDGVLIGEGEESFSQLCKYYVNQEGSLEEIDGIVFREGEGIWESRRGFIKELSQLPFLYTHMEDFENKIIYYESSRGCPFSCSYCLSSIDKSVRFRDLELVKKELQYFLDQKVPQVKFVDRTFNCKKSHALAIWEFLVEHDNGITNFHFEIAADLLTEEELAILKKMRPGLIQLEIGVQSTNPETIVEINRKMNFDKVSQMVQKVEDGNNIHQHLDLIVGLPYENYERFQESFNDVFALQPDQLQLGFLKVLKGSKMYEKAEEYGLVYRKKAPYEVLYTKWVTYEEVCELKAVEEMVETYYNTHQFDYTLKELQKEFEQPFEFFYSLAKYYEEEGLVGVNHSRLARYEILLRFAERISGDRKKYSQLLTLDLYLREKVKKRPDFSVNLQEYKEKLKELQKGTEKQNHIEVFIDEEGKEHFVIFDYGKRNPLNYGAKLTEVF